MEMFLTIVASLLVLIGLIGTIVPGVPGLPLMFGGFLLQGLLTNFTAPTLTVTLVLLGIIGLVTLLQLTVGPISTKAFGGTKWGVIGALLGLAIGLLLFPISFISILIAPLVGAILGELGNGQTRKQALKSGLGVVIGFFVTTVIEFALGLTFTTLFFLALF